MHWLLPVWPDFHPAGHSLHEAWPPWSWYLPLAQLAHVPVPALPFAHAAQLSALIATAHPAPLLHDAPVCETSIHVGHGHALHTMLAVTTQPVCRLEPGPHVPHVLQLDCPALFWYECPALHWAHVHLPARPCTHPAGQFLQLALLPAFWYLPLPQFGASDRSQSAGSAELVAKLRLT